MATQQTSVPVARTGSINRIRSGHVTLFMGFAGLLTTLLGGIPVVVTLALSLGTILLAQYAARRERERSSAAKGYLLGVITLVVAGMLLLDGPSGVSAEASSAQEISQGSVLQDSGWDLGSTQLSINELNLLTARTDITNTSEETRSLTFTINAADPDGGSHQIVGTALNVAPGETRQVEALASSSHPEAYVTGFSVTAQY